MSDVKLSVVIPTHNNLALLQRCVASWRQVRGAALELVVIEDGCADSTAAWLESVADGQFLRWFHEDDVFECMADNRGMREARGEYVLIWQDDMFVRSHGFVPWLLQMLDRNPDLAVLSLKRGVVFFPLDSTATGKRADPSHAHFQRFGTPWHAAEVHGTVKPWIVRRRCIERYGAMDEEFRPFHFDEMDYHLRLRSRGERIGTVPCEQMGMYVHHVSSSTSKLDQEWFEGVIRRNGQKLHDRWDGHPSLLEQPRRLAWRTPWWGRLAWHAIRYGWYYARSIPFMLRHGFPR